MEPDYDAIVKIEWYVNRRDGTVLRLTTDITQGSVGPIETPVPELNEAEQFCVSQGGELDTSFEGGSETSICLLDGGLECEVWAYLWASALPMCHPRRNRQTT